MLFVFFPVGLYLMWKYSNWSKAVKIIITAILAMAVISKAINGSPSDNKKPEAKEQTQQEQVVDENKEPAEEPEDDMASWTMEQKNCYKSAKNYVTIMAFSKQGLIDQLSSEAADNYPEDVAEFAVSKLEERGEVNWDEQCEKSAKSYLDLMAFSKEELIQQLSSSAGDKYTREQAERAVEKVYQ